MMDDISSHNGNNKATCDGYTCTRDSPARRVHSQPRICGVSFANRLSDVRSLASNGEASAGATLNPIPSAFKYKDLLGYNNVTNFGGTVEPHFKPPILQAKEIGINCYLIQSLQLIYLIKFLVVIFRTGVDNL